jgi:hypothetical protein
VVRQSGNELEMLRQFGKRTLEPVHLSDGVVDVRFHINPDSYEDDAEYNSTTVQTRAGFGIFFYGTKPPTIKLSGHTGIAGLRGPGGMNQLHRFKPQIGRPRKLLLFRYPNMFDHVRYVYLDSFTTKADNSMHLYVKYDIQMTEVGPNGGGVTASRIQGDPLPTSIKVYG